MMNVYFCLVGVANATRQRPAKSVNQVDGRRSNRNATFQRHNRSWLDVGRCQACKSYGARFVTVGSQQEPHARIIIATHHDGCLMRVDVSKSVGVPCEMVRLGCCCHARRVTVVSRTINKTHAINRKRKTPQR